MAGIGPFMFGGIGPSEILIIILIMCIYALPVVLFVYLVILASRLVRAVERISDKFQRPQGL